jgi:hypothetical protein
MQRIRYQAARVELALNDRSGSNATGAAGLPTLQLPLFPVSDQDRAALQYVAMGHFQTLAPQRSLTQSPQAWHSAMTGNGHCLRLLCFL